MQLGGKLLRSIGLGRAEVNLGLKNLTYNFMRFIFWETREGDGSVEDDTSDESRRQLEAVADLLNYRLGYKVEPYVAETSLTEPAILILANWPFTLSLSKGEKAVKRLRQAQPERYCIRQPSHTENCCD